MNHLPTYDVNAKAEGGWLAWQTALGAVVVGLLNEYTGMSPELIGTIGIFVAASSRVVIGHFLPGSA